MAEDTATKALINEMKEGRKKTVKDLDDIIKVQKEKLDALIAQGKSGSAEAKAASTKQLKAAKARDALFKADISLGADLKKNFSDIGTTITGGLEGMLSETFGPLGGIAASLTTGFFKRGQESKKSLESDQMQVTSTDILVEELGSKTGGKVEKLSAESAAETAGGVQEVGEGLGTTNLLLTDIEGHLNFMTENMEDAESRGERLRALKSKKAGGAVAGAGKKGADGSDDGGGIGVMDVFGGLFFVKKMKDALIAMRAVFGKGFFGKGGFFRNLKVVLGKQIGKIFGKEAMKSFFKFSPKLFAKSFLKLTLGFAGKLSTALIAPVIDGIFGYFSAEDWGVSKTSGVIGGILGGSEGGWMNAFMNAGKWALIGVKIGRLGGPPGMIAGGLIGAAIGGLLGWIGGDVIAQKLDAVGVWFMQQWDNVVQTLKDVWLAVMPKWFTEIDFEWSDILPTALVKLFKGEYFTIDVPEFHWYSLFPNFLVEWFKGAAEKISDKPWSWTDIFPKFVVDFFTGAIAKEDWEFKWTDLFPTWLVNIISGVGEAFSETPFHWYSLLPDFIVNLVKGVKIKEGSFEWRDLLPGFITKIWDAGKEAGTTEEGFDWTLLLPGWMGAAWGDVKGAGKSMLEGTFDWKALLPTWLHGAFDSSVALKGMAGEGIGALIDKISVIFEKVATKVKEAFLSIINKVISLIPGFEPVTEASKYWAASDVFEKNVDTESLTKQVASMSAEDLTTLKTGFEKEQAKYGLENEKEVFAIIAARQASIAETGLARGGVIVNRPAYLPKSGVVVGEHPSWSGRGAYAGMAGSVPDGGRELVTEGGSVIPLEGGRGGQLVANALAAPIAGAIMNSLAHDAIGLRGFGAGQTQSPNIVDASTNTNVTNNTIIRTPAPSGPNLHFEGRDFVHKIA